MLCETLPSLTSSPSFDVLRFDVVVVAVVWGETAQWRHDHLWCFTDELLLWYMLIVRIWKLIKLKCDIVKKVRQKCYIFFCLGRVGGASNGGGTMWRPFFNDKICCCSLLLCNGSSNFHINQPRLSWWRHSTGGPFVQEPIRNRSGTCLFEVVSLVHLY